MGGCRAVRDIERDVSNAKVTALVMDLSSFR